MLKVESVSAGYGDTTVLHDVSMEVADGQVVALLGPNGAGKTTLLRTIAGELPVSSGSIEFDGRDAAGVPPHQLSRRGLCHIPEGRAIYPSLSVRDNLIMQSRRGSEREAIARAIETFPALGRTLSQNAGSLSGGEQQMLATCRAYVSSPKLVLIDEASMGLAPLIVDQLFEFLHTLAASGASLLLVEQFVSRALDLADHAYILAHGQVMTSGPASGMNDAEIFGKYLGVEMTAPSVK